MAKDPPNKVAKLQEKMSKAAKRELTKKERKAGYRLLKKQIVEFENGNYGFIVFMREEGSKYWKAFSHSAVILSGHIGPRLKRKFRLQPDTDFGAEASDKVVIVQSMKTLVTELASLRIYPVVEKENSIRFELDGPITHEKYADMLGEEDRMKELANKVFVPTHVVPVLDDEIRKLQRHVRILTSSMKAPEREAYGIDMRKVVVQMKRLTVRLAHDKIELADFLEQEKELLLELDEFVNVVMSEGPYDVIRVAKFGEQYLRVQAEIERETRLMIAREVEADMKGKARKSGKSKVKQDEVSGEKS
ncbi:hypothetical protein IJH19_01075 [Candidatus Saccharibacteria bacterium]|nr:hypothetical protein [Candidatus Saccharibacteria bacterium]